MALLSMLVVTAFVVVFSLALARLGLTLMLHVAGLSSRLETERTVRDTVV